MNGAGATVARIVVCTCRSTWGLRGKLYVMDRVSHHLQEERPHDFYTLVSGFLDQAV